MGQPQVTLNELPVKTWEWLGVNETYTDTIAATDGSCQPQVRLPEAGMELRQAALPASVGGGMGAVLDAWFAASADCPLLYANGAAGQTAAVIYNYAEQRHCCDRLAIYAAAGSNVTVLMACTAAAAAAGTASLQTKIYAEAGASVRLVQVQLLGTGFRHFNDLGSVLQAGATLDVLQLELGGAEVYSGAVADLAGTGSAATISTGYYGRAAQRLDLSHIALHRGKKTRSLLTAGGALRDRAAKLYRATIDLQNGAAGAVGEEQENVLLLNEGVSNKTIPLILCAEEDVQGNHGATIGRLDADLLFYLSSRGFSEKAAADMMARARVEALYRQIGNAELEALVRDYLEATISDAV